MASVRNGSESSGLMFAVMLMCMVAEPLAEIVMIPIGQPSRGIQVTVL